MSLHLDWAKAKLEILTIFLADRGFVDFQIEPPNESSTKSVERSEYVFATCVDVRKHRNLPRLELARIGIFCRATSTSSKLPTRKQTHITVDVLKVENSNSIAITQEKCRALLIEKATEIQDLIFRSFLTF